MKRWERMKKMLVIEGNSVYEIDEECARRKKVPKECKIYEKIMQEQKKGEKGQRREKHS